jgi:diaminohydroxyphosphoribosylaminopyrimidine deaminase/5-amino-6-(5-phosphoribosylamino)uracil reductase
LDTEADRYFMTLALDLAEKGRGCTSPNPMVGAVVVRDGVIVGRGYHRRAGEDHAEVIALRAAGERAAGATLYVTMEPCCHQGKTPPCTDAVIRSGVRQVVAAMTDPNPKVCGGGFACLNHSGRECITGVLEERARKLNEAYIKYITSGIPFVTLKLAITLDGRIAARDGSSRWITGPEARKRTHLLRSWSDAVMVGSGTVLADDPQLTVRDAEGRDPLRIVLDSRLRVPPDARVFSDNRVIVVTADSSDPNTIAERERRGIEVWKIGSGDRIPISETLTRLGSRQITSILCEGGGTLASSLIREKQADKLMLFIAPKLLGNGIDAFGDIGVSSIGESLILRGMETETMGDDLLVTGYPEYR